MPPAQPGDDIANLSPDPILQVEREIKSSPAFTGALQSHILGWSKRVKRQCSADPKQRVMVSIALTHYAHIALMQHEFLRLSPTSPKAVTLSSQLSRESATLRQALRAAGLPRANQVTGKGKPEKVFSTPARKPNTTELEAEHVA